MLPMNAASLLMANLRLARPEHSAMPCSNKPQAQRYPGCGSLGRPGHKLPRVVNPRPGANLRPTNVAGFALKMRGGTYEAYPAADRRFQPRGLVVSA